MATNTSKEKQSPANAPLELPKGYKPLSVGTMRLEVPERPGWHRHWFRGTRERLLRAQQAGYRFVNSEEADVNNFDLAGDSKAAGSTDLGSRLSVVSGDDIGEAGQPGRLYLMECPEAFYEHAQSLVLEQIDDVANALKGGNVGRGSQGETATDVSNKYVKDMKGTNLLTRRN